MPHTLIFVDMPSSDPEASARFYREVLGWEVEPRGEEGFQRIVPGGEFPGPDGEPSGVGNLHLGIYDAARPVPAPDLVPTHPGDRPSGPQTRVYVLVADEPQEDILARAEERGARIDWQPHWWGEFGGWNSSFTDPWGVQIILWTTGGVRPAPEGA